MTYQYNKNYFNRYSVLQNLEALYFTAILFPLSIMLLWIANILLLPSLSCLNKDRSKFV